MLKFCAVWICHVPFKVEDCGVFSPPQSKFSRGQFNFSFLVRIIVSRRPSSANLPNGLSCRKLFGEVVRLGKGREGRGFLVGFGVGHSGFLRWS